MNSVIRPKASKKKINTSENFELAYLRHQYFRRVKYNPTSEDMQPYMKIVEYITRNTFFTYFNLFRLVGMYHDDIMNIGRVHLVSFLGLYSLEKAALKKKEFKEIFERINYEKPTKKDFDQKNKANFTLFIKQRMEDLVRICRQKSRNIKGQSSEEYVSFSGTPKPPKNLLRILKESEECGYKKLDFSIFKTIRKKAKIGYDQTLFQFADSWYVAFQVEQKNLDLEDLIGSEVNPYDNIHNKKPDEILEEKESDGLAVLFNRRSDYRKKATLRRFISKNQNDKSYKEEIKTAKMFLRNLEN